MKILWYVSSHGWGHAARERELIRLFRLKHPRANITVASDTPEWFWLDTGIDSLVAGSPSPVVKEKGGEIDEAATLRHLRMFLSRHKNILDDERARQSELNPDFIVSDIDPVPIDAAYRNNIRAFGVGNFTWDWIMREMFPELSSEISLISGMYSGGTHLRLPMGPDYTPFDSTIDVPLLCAGVQGVPERVKNLLPPQKVCLFAMRAVPSWLTPDVPEGFQAVSCAPHPLHPMCLNISPSELNRTGACFSDLVAACDVVLTKPGYGIVSQILAMGKRAVFVTGRKFPEEKYLLRSLEGISGIALVGADSKAPPETASAIASIMKKPPPTALECNGVSVITDFLAQHNNS